MKILKLLKLLKNLKRKNYFNKTFYIILLFILINTQKTSFNYPYFQFPMTTSPFYL